tara:strand:- start:440 stop:901 length:462 start_codon:yes stop_codon:yes gene_type:complete
MTDKPSLDLEELYETKHKLDLSRIEYFNKILRQIHNKIKIASRLKKQDNFCTYVMPQIIVGYPNYNIKECVIYVVRSLIDNGFKCKYMHPNLLFIGWDHYVPEYVRREIKLKTGISIDSEGNKLESKVSFKSNDKKQTKGIYGDKLNDLFRTD